MKLVLRPMIVLSLIAVALAISWYPWRELDVDGAGGADQPTAAPEVPDMPPAPPADRADPAPPPMTARDQALANQVVALVNAERSKVRCGAVRPDARLAGAALAHSADLASRGYLSHVSSDGLDPWARARDAGYASPSGQNIAVGYPDATKVMAGWLASKSHRAAIVSCSSTAVGVGLARDRSGTPYWTQLLGR